MTGICDTCSGATVLEHLGRHRIPVEFCSRCQLVVGQLDTQRATAMRLREGETGDLPDREFHLEAVDEARSRLAVAARSLTSRRNGATVSDGERPVTPDQPSRGQP